ncbi:MAG: sulfate adenylyltransferase subunit CysN, partial [Myxococcales bacterium]
MHSHLQDLKEAAQDIELYLAQHEQKELLRFVAVGSVDDGKSTLIGRLLHDTQSIYDDQVAAVKKASAGKEDEIDFSLFTDGLKAEREQGITIDVAYRYFSTEKRKFIIADTPGHVQYTRNMATGASTADLAIILLDARLGVLPQSRRHAYIASLLGIPYLLVAVNKMDLVDWSEEVFERLQADFREVTRRLSFRDVRFFPISARKGDNVVSRSARMDWYAGGTILSHLESIPVARDRSREAFRYPVQNVLRPNLDYRGFAGQIASGSIRPGDEVVVLPSRRRTRVKAIDTFEGEQARAFAPMSVTLRLADEVDLSRGEMLARPGEEPKVSARFEAMLVWLSERPWDQSRALLLKHTTRTVPARIDRVQAKTDLDALTDVPSDGLSLNDIGRVTIRCNRPIFCDAYAENRVTGAFILIDALSNDTVAAGMIVSADALESGARPDAPVTEAERSALLGQRGAVLFVDGDAALQTAHTVDRALLVRALASMVVDARELADEALVEVAVRCV